jgi:8-oxo-dGTP pyrophosphatase MutT (NUDIX family)
VLKFCPRCGSRDFSFQKDSSFRCAACSLHYYINSAAAVVALITDDQGRLLFTRRAHDPGKGELDLPGGFVNVMESAEEALLREIREELNCEISEYSYLRSYPNRYLFGGLVYFTTDLVYQCTLHDTATLSASDDVSAIEFLDARHVNLQNIHLESIKNIVADYRKNLR